MKVQVSPPDELVALSRRLGDPNADLAILAEGNASALADDGTFWVKASGFSLNEIGPEGFVQVRIEPIQRAMQEPSMDDAAVRQVLAESRVDPAAELMPSVETFMHADLLSLPEVRFVGHTHPTALLSLLSLEECEEIARRRLFPDEIVCCGPAACYVPYVDPGLPLAQAIRASVHAYIEEIGTTPKTIWLQNHGLIALGRTAREVESATFMSVKAARVWLGALSTGRLVQALDGAQIARIHTRPDEHYRQRLLWQIRNPGANAEKGTV